MPHQFTCQQCSTPFTRAHKRPYKFCSQRCAGAAKMTRRVQACEACGRLYLPTFGPRQAISRYCSRACLNKSKAVSVFTRSPNKQHGYVDIKLPDGTWRREHWLIAEQVVACRPLARDEVVHHVNGIRSDNRPENLRVMTRGEHTLLHALQDRKSS